MEQRHIVFQVFHQEEQPFAFGQSLIVFFGLHGMTTITCRNTAYEVGAAGLFVVNPFELYRVSCMEYASVIALQIPRTMLKLAGWDGKQQFSCYARDAAHHAAEYEEIRVLYATLFQDFFQDAPHNASRISSNTIQLTGLLLKRFSMPADDAAAGQREQTMRRLKRILDTIHDHWHEELSLTDIAGREDLSISYLSRFFQKHLQMTFTQYLTNLRLHHAIQMLCECEDSVTQIAYECGFRDVGALIQCFRTQFGVTPGQYRAEQRKMQKTPHISQTNTSVQESMTTLLAYLDPAQNDREIVHKVRQVEVYCDRGGIPLRNTWRRVLNIGYAHDALLADVRDQVCRAQHEIGFEYLRFHGLFDEDMKVYTEDEKGKASYDFTYVDLVFDFIYSQGLRAYVELSFLPPLLAREETRIFDRATVISGCRDLDKWAALLRATLLHFIARYGRETVRKWRFTTISINYVFLGCMTMDEYFALYTRTYQTVKAVDSSFSFGGPGGFANLVWEPNGFQHFLAYAKEHSCVPDFLTVQCYPHRSAGRDPAFMDFTISQKSAPTVLSGDEDFMQTVRLLLEELLKAQGLSDCAIWFEECNSTLWQRDLSGDTCYKAVWMVKNFCENYDCAEAFGYWLLTDFIDEHNAFGSVYHGGYGVFTYNGVPKSGYQAMRFLRQLGDEKVDAGPGWFLTRRGTHFQLLLYNYCHYDNLYRYRYRRLEKPEEAYSVFEAGSVQHMQFELYGIPDGTYRMESQTIGRVSGSSFDKWLEIGAPNYIRPDELRYLREVSQPSYHVRETEVHGCLRLEESLQPLETRLLLLHRIG